MSSKCMKSKSEEREALGLAEKVVEGECDTYTYSDTLTLRPPPSKLESSVPRPTRGEVPCGLPLWNKTPLYAKLPLMAGPDGPLVFTRGRVGEKLWKSAPGVQFQLSDPYNYEVKFDYEAIHDGHLRKWLRQPHNLQLLQRQGLVTPGLHAICTVDQYNNFRQFLSKLYSDAVRVEAEKIERLNMENLMVKKALRNAEREAYKLKRLEDSNEVRKKNMSRLEQLEMERLEKCKKRLQRVLDRAARAEVRREAEVIERKKRMEAFDRRIQSRIIAANKIERHNKIRAMKARHNQDVEMKKMFEKRAKEREEENRQKAEAKWKRKVEEQLKRIAKEKYLQEQRELAMEQERKKYMKKMEKEWAKIQEELEQRKCRSKLDKIRYSLRQKSIKQIMKSVSEAYASHKSFLSQDEDTMHSLLEHIQQTLREIRYDLEPYIVIAHAKSRLEKQENVPLPVGGAIKYLLEQTIVEYTASNLKRTMDNFAKRVLSAIDELKSQPQNFDRHLTGTKKSRSSMSAFVQSQSIASSTKTARISTQELVIPIRKTEEELNVSPSQLLSIKDRPPTPMPSIHTFTEVLFKEPEVDEFYEAPTVDYQFIEQAKLNKDIEEVSNRIFQMIPSRVRSVIESRSYDRISVAESTSSVEKVPENKPVARLCSVILFEDSVKDYVLTQIVDRIILGFMKDINLTPSVLRLKIKKKLEEMNKQNN